MILLVILIRCFSRRSVFRAIIHYIHLNDITHTWPTSSGWRERAVHISGVCASLGDLGEGDVGICRRRRAEANERGMKRFFSVPLSIPSPSSEAMLPLDSGRSRAGD